MSTLSNNRGNATQLGLWCVNANNDPSNANANNWGARQSPQARKPSRDRLMSLNQPPVQSASGLAATADTFRPSGCAGQSPLIRRSRVAPSRDDGRKGAMRKRRNAAAIVAAEGRLAA